MAEGAKKTGPFVMVVIVAILVAIGLFVLSQPGRKNDPSLDKSPIGFSGLAPWLRSNEIETTVSHPRLGPPVESFGLRILPLYDIDLYDDYQALSLGEDRISAKTLRDIPEYNYTAKITDIPTVVLLPKWNGAMLELNIAHEQSLLSREDIENLLSQIGLWDVSIIRTGPAFTPAPDPAIFQVQLFNRGGKWPKGCSEAFGFQAGALILRCKFSDEAYPVIFVSDPDMMNNQGLATGDNAARVPDILTKFIPKKRPKHIYVDLSPDLLVSIERDEERQDYERGSDEFLRMLNYPLSLFWASLLIILGLFLWRGAKRFGPLSRANTSLAITTERSRQYSLGAKARLLRLSGHDGQILSDFVRGQMAELARRIFGPDDQIRGVERLMTILARRDAELAGEFETVSRQLIDEGAQTPRHLLYSRFARYQSLRKKVLETYGTS